MKKEDYIFYLKLEKKLPENFFHLATTFSLRNITLVPITPQELKKINVANVPDVLMVTSNISSWRNFLILKKTYLNFALTGGKLNMFHLSSFDPGDHKNMYHWKNYNCYRLPLDMEEICDTVSDKVQCNNKNKEKWPGGRRVPLDKSISAN